MSKSTRIGVTIDRDPILDHLTPGQRARLKRIKAAYSATDPHKEPPLVVIGPGGDYARGYTPNIPGPQRRYEQAVVWSLACVAIGAALMAALVTALNLWPGR